MSTKVSSYVGFAIKSNKVLWGVDNILLCRKKPYVILCDRSLGSNSYKKLHNYVVDNNIEEIQVELEDIVPNKNCKALAILEINLANAIIKELKE